MEEKKEKLYKCCLRCGRKLENPEHRKLGFGPVCWKKQQTEKKKRLFLIYKK